MNYHGFLFNSDDPKRERRNECKQERNVSNSASLFTSENKPTYQQVNKLPGDCVNMQNILTTP